MNAIGVWGLVLAVLAAWGLFGCDSVEDVKIKRDPPPPNGRVGEAYTHTFEVSRTVDDAWFIDCRHIDLRDNPKMDMDRSGKLTFQPLTAGPQKLCIEYRRRDGQIDRYEPEIQIAHKKGESPEEIAAAVDAFRNKLAAVHEATSKRGGGAVPCPPSLGADRPREQNVTHCYDEAWLGAVAKKVAIPKDAKNVVAFRPPSHRLLDVDYDLQHATIQNVKALTRAQYLVVARPVRLELPFMSGKEKFLMGVYSGLAFLVELASAKVLCTRPLEFRSSDKIEWTEIVYKSPLGDEQSEDPPRAFDEITRDFGVNGRLALTKMLERDAPNLQLVTY